MKSDVVGMISRGGSRIFRRGFPVVVGLRCGGHVDKVLILQCLKFNETYCF